MNKTLHRKFCISVRDFVKEYACLATLKQKVECGEVLEETQHEELKNLLSSISQRMEEIEEMERELGYANVGIPVQDANFEGFSFVNGEIEGSAISNAYLIAEPWICSFWDAERTSESDCYKFFVGTFLYYMAGLADSSVMDELNGKLKGKENETENVRKGRETEGKKDPRKVFHPGNWIRRNWDLFLKRVYAFFGAESGGAEEYL